MSSFTLKQHEITVDETHRNLPPSALYEHAILHEKDAHIAENGALVAYSGAKTGRSPKDKRVVKQGASENDIWWGPVNIPLAGLFTTNFAAYEEEVSAEVKAAGQVAQLSNGRFAP